MYSSNFTFSGEAGLASGGMLFINLNWNVTQQSQFMVINKPKHNFLCKSTGT